MQSRRCIKSIVVLFFILLAVPLSLAFEFDNVKEFYDVGDYGKIEIINIFGLGGTIAEYTLLKNSDYCGTNCFAEGVVEVYKETSLFSDMKTYNLHGNEVVIDNLKVFLWIEDDLPRWVLYDPSEILFAGRSYRWRIEGVKDWKDSIDWVGTSNGLELNEWALWESPEGMQQVEEKGEVVTYTDTSRTVDLGNERFNTVLDFGGYFEEGGVVKTRAEVSNLMEATTAGTGKRVWGCDIKEDEYTSVKCNSLNITNEKFLLDYTATSKIAGDYPIRIKSYNDTSKKIETKEIDSVSLDSIGTKENKVVSMDISDELHLGITSTTVNIHGNNSDARFKDNLIYVSIPARNFGAAALLEINGPANSFSTHQVGGLSDYIGVGVTITNVTFNGYSTYSTDVDIFIDLVNENWTEGDSSNPGNSSYNYNNDSATGSWYGGNRSGTNPKVCDVDYGPTHDGWASCVFATNLDKVQDGYDNWNWLNFRVMGNVAGIWNIGSLEAATPLWTVNITYSPAAEFPLLDLNAPSNNTIFFFSNIAFNFTATSSINTSMTCDIYTDSVLNTSTSCLNGTLTNTIINGFEDGSHSYYVKVSDGTNINTSETRNFTVATSPPTITFVEQQPADIDVINAFGRDNVLINYTITDANGYNASTVILYYKSNSSSLDVIYYQNGTEIAGWQVGTDYYNLTDSWEWKLDDNEIYRGTYNYPNQTYMEIKNKSSYDLDKDNELIIAEFYNFSTTSNYTFLELNIQNQSENSLSSRGIYCNSSNTGNVIVNTNCVDVFNILASDLYNHTHGGGNSSHYVVPLTIDNGKIGGVQVTPTSYIILRGRQTDGWDVKYISNTTRTNAFQTSGNNGISRTNFEGSFDMHLHQYDGSDTVYYFVNAKDNYGFDINSTVRSDVLELVPLPPISPDVYNPTTQTYVGDITINYTNATAYDFTAVWYNITLVDLNETYVSTIISNNTANLSYTFDSTVITDGVYKIKVVATDRLNQTSFGVSENFTIDDTPPPIIITSPTNRTYRDSNISINVTTTSTDESSRYYSLNNTPYVMFTGNTTIILGEGIYNFTFFINDSINNTNSSSVYFSIDLTFPNATLSSPTNRTYGDYNISINVINISTDESSRYYSLNNTPYVMFTGNTTFFAGNGSHSLTFFMNDTANNTISISRDFTVDTSIIYYIEESHSGPVGSGSSQTYTFNVAFNNVSISMVNVSLTYNNTLRTVTRTNFSSNKTLFSSTFWVPSTDILAVKNITWGVTINYLNGSTTPREYRYLQNITAIRIYACSSPNATTIEVINGTFLDEETKALLNGTLQSTFYIYAANSTITTNITLNFNHINVSNFTICITPNASYRTYAKLRYYGSGYDTRDYYLINATLGTGSQNLNLYQIASSESIGVTHYVYDENGNPLVNYYIFVQRYDVSTDTYRLVAMGRADEDGKDYIYLEPYDVWYRYIVQDDTRIVKTFTPLKITDTTQTLRISETSIGAFINSIDEVSYSLEFINATKTFRVTYSSTTGQVSKGCLSVIRRTPLGDTYECDKCESSASATISCSVTQNETYIATFYIESSPPQFIDSLTVVLNTIKGLTANLGKEGIAYALIIIGALAFAGVMLGYAGVLILTTIGLIIVTILGLWNLTYGTILAISLIVGLLVAKVKGR